MFVNLVKVLANDTVIDVPSCKLKQPLPFIECLLGINMGGKALMTSDDGFSISLLSKRHPFKDFRTCAFHCIMTSTVCAQVAYSSQRANCTFIFPLPLSRCSQARRVGAKSEARYKGWARYVQTRCNLFRNWQRKLRIIGPAAWQ